MIHDVGIGRAFAHSRFLNSPMHSFLSVDPLAYTLAENKNIGDFTSIDPLLTLRGDTQSYMRDSQKALLNPQALNSYGYANENPVTSNDPNGKNAAFANQMLGVGASFEAFGLGVDSTVFGAPVGLLIGGVGLVALTAGSLNYYFSKSDSGSAQISQDKSNTQRAPKPEDIRGKSSEEIGKMMEEKGWPSKPGTKGGTRWENPQAKGEQLRIEPGKSTNSDPVKRGPYGRISGPGPNGGTKTDPIPLKGNPTLKKQ